MMNTFRKMVMIPVDEYNTYRSNLYSLQMQQQQQQNPMQRELEEIREIYGSSIPDDQRAKLESEIISKYTSSVPDSVSGAGSDAAAAAAAAAAPRGDQWISETISDFAKTNRLRSKQLYSILENRIKRWNDNGELLNRDNEPIAGTNIVDLISYATQSGRPSKIRPPPEGLGEFIQLLEKANVPKYVLGSKGLDAVEAYKQQQQQQEEYKRINNEEFSPKTSPYVSPSKFQTPIGAEKSTSRLAAAAVGKGRGRGRVKVSDNKSIAWNTLSI